MNETPENIWQEEDVPVQIEDAGKQPDPAETEIIPEAVSVLKKKKRKKPQNQDLFGVTNGRHVLWKSFLIALITATAMFLPSIIWDEGYFLFLGDFNSQQVPFYMLAHRAVRTGNLGWNWYTDLGANFIGSYSFYLLGSPFFWLTLPLPDAWVPYSMGPLLILKYAAMSLTATAWLRRVVKKPEYQILGGLLYAFSGYTMYNTFFNHFLDVMVFFPLLMIGMDELVDNNRHGVFALSVCLAAVVNFVFFVAEAVFMILYYIAKVWRGGYNTTLRGFFAVAFEAVLGFAMSAFIVWPTLIVILANPRSTGLLYGYNVWIYNNARKYWVILLNFFFPPELPSQPILVTDSYMRWTSVQAYIPVFSMAGVLAFIAERKKHWLKSLIIISLIMAFLPGPNSAFTALNSSYYARWYFMLTLVLIAATMKTLDDGSPEALYTGWKITTVFTVCVIAAMVLTPDQITVKNELDEDVKKVVLGIFNKDFIVPFIFMAVTCVASSVVLWLLMKQQTKYPKLFASYLVLSVCVFGFVYGNYYIAFGKTRSYDTKNYIIPDAIQGEDRVELPDPEGQFYRIDNDDSFINMGMFWQVPDMHAFHSVVPASIMDYYIYIGDERDVNSKMDYKRYASRGVFSVKYFYDRLSYKSDNFGDTQDPLAKTKMPGYTYRFDTVGYAVWENDYYIPMGFVFDKYILRSDADKIKEGDRDKLMLKALILDDEQAEKYAGYFDEQAMELSFVYTEETYKADCRDRAAVACDTFSYDNTGFRAHIDLEEPRMVFFSVPYEKDGWTAQVNGRDVDVENVQIGFIAVACEAGSNDIVFRYETPGLALGIKVSLACTVILAVWCIAGAVMNRKRRNKA
ncbi:MAG: YfhO family protein [Firmicutes bacterium]|nr:YfhO family protein [Bacillota bacterium]